MRLELINTRSITRRSFSEGGHNLSPAEALAKAGCREASLRRITMYHPPNFGEGECLPALELG